MPCALRNGRPMARSIAYGRLSAVLFLAATGMLRCTAATMPIAATQAVPKPLGLLWPSQSFDLHDQQEVAALALSPDGSRIAIASASVVLLLDRHTGREIWRSQAVSRSVASVHFSSDGERLIAANGWNSPKGRGILIFEAGTGGRSAASRATDMAPATPCCPRTAKPFSVSADRATALKASTRRCGTPERASCCISPPTTPPDMNGRHSGLFSAGWQTVSQPRLRLVHLHETASGKLVSQLDNVQASAVTISPDGARAVLCTGDGLVIWDIQRNDARRIITGQQVRGAAFVNEDLFITWGVELRMWNAVSGDEVSWSGTYQSDVVFGAASGTLIVGSNGRRVQVFGLTGTGAPPGVDPARGPATGFFRASDAATDRGGRARRLKARPGAHLTRGGRQRNARSNRSERHYRSSHGAGLRRYACTAGCRSRRQRTKLIHWNRTPLHFAVERFTGPNSLRVIDLLLERAHGLKPLTATIRPSFSSRPRPGTGNWHHLIAKGAQYDLWSAAALGDADPCSRVIEGNARLSPAAWADNAAKCPLLGVHTGSDRCSAAGRRPADITDAWGATPEQDLRANGHIDLGRLFVRQDTEG